MIFTIFVFFIVLSVLVIIHECGHFIAAKKNGVKVEEFGFGLPPRIFGIHIGETLYSLNWLPFGGFVKVFGEEASEVDGKKLTDAEKDRSFVHKKPWQKVVILTAGVIANFLLGWIIITYLLIKGVPAPSDIVSVEKVIKDTPAYTAGIQVKDVIVSISNGKKTIVVDELNDITIATKDFAGQEVTIQLKRGDQNLAVQTIPRVKPPKDEGSLGIVITNFVIKKYSIIEAPFYSLKEAVLMTKELINGLVQFITLKIGLNGLAGPVKIAQITGQAARIGVDALLQLVALLSLNLAIFNILPIPALDGGRLAFVLYEAITKKKIKPQFEQKVNLIGFVSLIALMLLITINDIFSFFK